MIKFAGTSRGCNQGQKKGRDFRTIARVTFLKLSLKLSKVESQPT